MGSQGRMRVVYPLADGRSQRGFQQHLMVALLFPLRDHYATRDRNVLVGGDQFVCFTRGDPGCFVVPDLYLVDDEAIDPREVACWKVWEHGGKAPALAVEFVSSRTHVKPYASQMVERYERLGVRELVRFDPDHVGHRNRHLRIATAATSSAWLAQTMCLAAAKSPPARQQCLHLAWPPARLAPIYEA